MASDNKLACAYESRSPIQPPTRRIRLLEGKLQHARRTLQQLKCMNLHTGSLEIDLLLEELQNEPTAVPDFRPPVDSPVSDRKVRNMLGGCGQLIHRAHNTEVFFGPSSGFSFVCRTLELFLEDSDVVLPSTNIHSAILDLFHQPIPQKQGLHTHQAVHQDLPSRATCLILLDSLFARCSMISQFLLEAEMGLAVDGVYQRTPRHFDMTSSKSLALLHSVLALGYLYHIPRHRTHGCQVAEDEALKHFFAAREALDITQCNDLLSLQTLLCIIVFLISTSHMVDAHPYLSVACSLALRLGLHARIHGPFLTTDEDHQKRLRIYITILKLDVYSSIVLGLPPIIDSRGVSKELCSSEDDLVSDLSLHGVGSHESIVVMGLSLKHLELLHITASGIGAVFQPPSDSKEEDSDDGTFPVSIKDLEEAGAQFQSWAKSFSLLLRQMRDVPKLEIVKYELEMTYYFGQIVLYLPFLHYLKDIANGEALSRSQSQHALACIKISSITITRAEEMMKRGFICSASWMSVYSIFLSVVCLMFLIAAHNGTSRPSGAWKKAQFGIRLLAAARCQDGGATACLGILRKLISALSHTVDFDLDQIESSTARLCQYSLMYDNTADEVGSARPLDKSWTAVNRDTESNFLSRSQSAVLTIPRLLHQAAMPQVNNQPENLEAGAFPCGADEILAQAQGVSLGYRMDEFINLDDFQS